MLLLRRPRHAMLLSVVSPVWHVNGLPVIVPACTMD
jgi:hypothetical protein